jgi:hypothetical protein
MQDHIIKFKSMFDEGLRLLRENNKRFVIGQIIVCLQKLQRHCTMLPVDIPMNEILS